MKVKDIIKKQTVIIAIAVILVVVTFTGVSYAIFFDVQTNRNNQVITAGTLKLTLSGVSALDSTKIGTPKTNEDGLKSAAVSYTVKNTDSNLPASYSIYLYADTNNAVNPSMIKISLDGNATAGSSYKALNALGNADTTLISGKTLYKIDSNKIAKGANGTTTKYIRAWVDEDLVTSDLTNQKVDLKLYIVSEVDEAAA